MALTTRQLRWLAIEILVKVKYASRVNDCGFDFVLGNFSKREAKTHVVKDGHVWIESVTLKHESDVAIAGGQIIDNSIADLDLATGH